MRRKSFGESSGGRKIDIHGSDAAPISGLKTCPLATKLQKSQKKGWSHSDAAPISVMGMRPMSIQKAKEKDFNCHFDWAQWPHLA